MAGISPFGASCTILSLLGNSIISGQNALAASAFFGTTLAPWPNRLDGGRYELGGVEHQVGTLDSDQNANHGLIFDKRAEVRSHTSDTLVLGFDLRAQGYPFDVDLELVYQITDGFSVQATATNRSSGPAPFAIGFHPYFKMPLPATLRANVTEHFVTDQRMIPIGKEEIDQLELQFPGTEALDDCYFGDWRVQFETASYKIEISQQNLPYLMLYKPAHSLFADGSPALAIEPMSAPANAFATEIDKHLLLPGEKKSFGFEIRILN